MKEFKVTYGKAEELSNIIAFDFALWDVGIGSHIIIKLSSIIPRYTKIDVRKVDNNKPGVS